MAPKTKKRRTVPRLPIRDEKGWHKTQEQLSLELQQQNASSDSSMSEDEREDTLMNATMGPEEVMDDQASHYGSFSLLSAIEELQCPDDEDTEDDETSFGQGTKNKGSTGSSFAGPAGESHLGPEDYRILVGSLAAELIEDPRDSLANLKKLLLMIKSQASCVKKSISSSEPHDAEARSEHESRLKLLLISCLAIFQDILPGYGIRPLTAAEQAVKVSKEVKQQRDHEFALLSHYRQYLTTLLSFIIQVRPSRSTAAKSTSTPPLFYPFHICHVAMKCLLELLLLTSAQHNFFRELIECLAYILFNDKRGALIELASKALAQGFSEDDSGFFTWSVIKVLSDDCHKHHYYIPAKVLESFLSIRTGNLKAFSRRSNANHSSRHRKRDGKSGNHRDKTVHVSKRHKKYLKEELKWKKELEETEAVISQDQLNLWHQESLRYLFRIYIGLIKKNPTAPLLTFVFPGLLKFSNMIHEDYFADLLVSLKHILPSILAHTKTSMLCLTAVFTILTQQSQFLQLDLHWYYKVFYQLMLQIPTRKLELDMHPIKHADAGKMGGSFGKKTKKTTHDATMSSSLPPRSKKVSNVMNVWQPIPEHGTLAKEQEATESVDTELVLAFMACFEKMFLGRMQVPLDRVAAFIHRMIWICLSLDTASILLLTDLLFKLFRYYANLIPILLCHAADEGDSFGSGAYDPLAEDPDQCHASSESVLPLVELLSHLHPSREVKSKMTQLYKLYHGN